jgi:hypothetical protein
MLMDLGVVKLLCNLISYEPSLVIKENAVLVAAAILLGGYSTAQNEFAKYIVNDTQNDFMCQMKIMLVNAFEVVKKS